MIHWKTNRKERINTLILVSSCLLGLYSKYDGNINNTNELLMEYSALGQYIPMCPEQMGGLPTPRQAAEIKFGTGEEVLQRKKIVINKDGEDVTDNFIKGAEQVLHLIKVFPVKAAILKERSPSCGVKTIYDGTFQRKRNIGQGVTTALLKQKGIPVYSEEELTRDMLRDLLSL